MATCQICKYAGNPKNKPPCSDCKGYSKYEYEKPQTNADRIRAMSDEEFSCFLALAENRKTGKTTFDDTSDFWMDWLKQPAEGE